MFLLLDYKLLRYKWWSFIISPQTSHVPGTLTVEWRQQVPLTFVMGASMVMEWILAMDG